MYDLRWTGYWSYWFERHGAAPADLSQASGFRLYSMMVQAAVDGMGVALGHSLMIVTVVKGFCMDYSLDLGGCWVQPARRMCTWQHKTVMAIVGLLLWCRSPGQSANGSAGCPC